MKKTLLTLGLLLVASTAYAYLPVNIEGVIKTWFSGAGKLIRFEFNSSSNPGTAATGKFKLYFDGHCLRASANAAPFQCIAGSGDGSATGGCTESAGTLTCPVGFDAPAAAATGSFITLKEGSNNGTEIARIAAPANLSTSRTNTLNTDGTFNAADVETTNSQGLDAYFHQTTGILSGRNNLGYIWLPDGAPAIDPAGGVTAVLSANGMRCATIVARDSIQNATNLAHRVAVLGGNCSTCIYNEDGTMLIAPLMSGVPATASDCTSAAAKTMSGLDAFSLAKGTRYRLCTTSDSALTQWYKGPYYANVTANLVATTAGTAATTGTSGKCPTTTGALSAADVYPPITRVY